MATCFYCGMTLDPRSILPHRQSSDSRYTKDHIYPRHLTRQLTGPQRAKLTETFAFNNLVDSCQGCNAYKGHLHPLDWLVIMPSDFNAKKLAERMVSLGEDMGEVFAALRRRKKT